MRTHSGRAIAWLSGIALALGLVARIAWVDRPADWRSLNGWREADYAQMARAFYREDANPLHPRVDWRGTSSGLVESELPILPWTSGMLYRALGHPDERVLRALAALLSVCALVAFWQLARRALPAPAAQAAAAVFAANGMTIYLATAIQPEAALLFAEICAALAIFHYSRTGSTRALFGAGALVALATLAKASALYLGPLLGWFVLRRLGRGAFRTPAVWLAAVVATAPPLLWYAWGRAIFETTGLSLGISNETHGLSLPVLLHPSDFVLGNLLLETRDVFSFAGIPLAALALRAGWDELEFPLVGYAAALLFYVAAADTTGESWAWYYRVLSLPAGCLLIGLGVATLMRDRKGWAPAAAVALVIATLACGVLRAAALIGERDRAPRRAQRFDCYRQLGALLPPGALLVVRGGRSVDWHGHPVAYNASEPFHWMDRRGWNYASDQFSLEHVASFAERGATHWLALPDDFVELGMRERASARFVLAGACADYSLFELTKRASQPTPE